MQRIHLPQVIGALAAGVLLGPAVFGFIAPNESISVIADLGVILLLFAAGMETDFKQLRVTIKSSAVISASGVLLALGLGFGVAMFFDFPIMESLFVGIMIASMSTGIMAEALQELGKMKSKAGVSLMGASLFDDIFVIIILAVAVGASMDGFSALSLLTTLGMIIAFFIFALITGYGVSKLFNYLHGKFGATRRLAIFAIGYCFAMAFFAERFGLAGITGAYIAGIAFCTTRCHEFLESHTHELSYLFLPPFS